MPFFKLYPGRPTPQASLLQDQRTRFVVPLLAVVTLSTTRLAAADLESVYNPMSFTIGYWCGPPADQLTAGRFAEIKAAGFTVAFPPCSGLTVEQNRRMLDLCSTVGLQAVIADSRMVRDLNQAGGREALDAIVRDYADHPALLGYHVVDEPGAASFDGLAAVADYLAKRDARHPAYFNLLPTYGRDFGALGTATYDDYVRTFVRKVRPFVVSYDHYPFTQAGDRADFFENLATVRDVSLDAAIPFWNIVLVTQHFGYRDVSEAELRFQAMQTLAYGGRGLLWFTYWMPSGVPDAASWKHSLIAADGTRDSHYEMVRRVNAEAKTIGDALGGALSTDVILHAGDQASMRPHPDLVPHAGRLTVGLFRRDQQRLALVTNRDYSQPIATVITIRAAQASVQRFDSADSSWSSIGDGETVDVSLELPPGGGVLLRW